MKERLEKKKKWLQGGEQFVDRRDSQPNTKTSSQFFKADTDILLSSFGIIPHFTLVSPRTNETKC
jgi:hypothetical protein